MDLSRAVGSPPQTTMRGHLRALTEMGVLERWRRPEFPGSVDYALTDAGRELLGVADVLGAWLEEAPGGPRQLGDLSAKSGIKALVDGWSSGIIRVLAARPFSLTELNTLISGLSYPSLERRLGAMRLAGLIEACPGQRRRTPYQATGWLRQAIAPLSVAAGWERRRLPSETAPIGRIDVEAALLLTVPIVRLSAGASGACRMGVEIRNGGGATEVAGVLVTVEDGRVVSCVSRLQGSADAWVSGTAQSWIDAVLASGTDGLEIGGDCDLVRALLDGLNEALNRAHQAT